MQFVRKYNNTNEVAAFQMPSMAWGKCAITFFFIKTSGCFVGFSLAKLANIDTKNRICYIFTFLFIDPNAENEFFT